MLKDATIDQDHSKEIDRVAAELDYAFSTIGFVYLKNHGIPQNMVSRFKYVSLVLKPTYFSIA